MQSRKADPSSPLLVLSWAKDRASSTVGVDPTVNVALDEFSIKWRHTDEGPVEQWGGKVFSHLVGVDIGWQVSPADSRFHDGTDSPQPCTGESFVEGCQVGVAPRSAMSEIIIGPISGDPSRSANSPSRADKSSRRSPPAGAGIWAILQSVDAGISAAWDLGDLHRHR